jgi:mannose-1-phosphate guanylyltransferase
MVAACPARELLAHDGDTLRALSTAFITSTGSNKMNNTWALVLAAGEGSRLRALTTQGGVAVPKQFCSLRGGPSLLQEALLRAEAIAPRQRVLTIVAEQHRPWWETALWTLPKRNIVVQPRNRGTANGLLLPLLHIAERDPEARVAILPSDHYVQDEAVLARALRLAAANVGGNSTNLFLLGISPDEADPELGYIVPGSRDESGALRVSQFIEKPSATMARAMMDRGALWNAFILVGAVRAFIELFERRHSDLVKEMRLAIRAGAVADLYARLPELDFSRDVLEGSESLLRVQPVPACGWSDLGTPTRVSQALGRLELREEAIESIPSTYLSLAAQHARLRLAV